MIDQKKKLLYISFIPLTIIVLLIIGAGYLLLADDIKLPKFDKGPQIRRLAGFPTIVYVDKETKADKERLVITNEKDLNEFLNRVDKTGLLTMRDKVDFNKEYVIAVATSVEDPEGHKVKVKKVYEDKPNKSLLVSIQETFPGENCKVESAPHIAVDLVAINKTNWKIEFDKVKDISNCSSESSSTNN